MHYIKFVQDWIGIGFVFPFFFVFVLFGPLAMFFLGSSKHEVIKNIGIFVGTCTFLACFFLCLATGIYFGKFHGLGGWGIPLGFLLFIGGVLAVVFLSHFVQKVFAGRG